jgi:hypothetical protein
MTLFHPITELLPAHLAAAFFLYVETHFRIGRLPSRFFRRMPEILFDLPHRIEPGHDLPLLLVIKDANRFPIELLQLQVDIKIEGEPLFTHDEELHAELVQENYWWRIFSVPVGAISGGALLEPSLLFRKDGRLQKVRVDNYPTLSHRPLPVWLDKDGLPGSDSWLYGDLHYHSHLTSDQVEFGAHPEAAAVMAEAMGLDFFAVTDHSYDLDDCWDDYLRNDAALCKWNWLQSFVHDWNRRGKNPLIIAGEELSAGNSRDRNVHFLLLNEPQFFHGWGDSAEKWLQIRPQWPIAKVLDRLSEKSLAFAGHAESRPPRLQRLFLGRDHWRKSDYEHDRINGVQMWNSLNDASLDHGIAAWTKLLLSGRRPVLIGGNDAHGDFGRWRQIALPFISLQEKEEHLFGQVRTGIRRSAEKPDLGRLLEALRAGQCMVTSGPAAWLKLADSTGALYQIGDSCKTEPHYLQVRAESSPAFGPLTSISLCIGDLTQKKETRRPLPALPSGSMLYEIELPARDLPRQGYLRLEANSQHNSLCRRCFTNPLFLNNS